MKKLSFLLIILFITISSVFASDTGEKIANYLKDMGISPYLVIVLIAMLPIVELRGAIPVGVHALNLDFGLVIIFSIIGNMIPIFFILFFFEVVEKILRKVKFFDNFFNWLFKRTRARSASIEKYEELGLVLFVGIPLPITGAWTGSLAAYLFKLSYWKSLFFIFLGVLLAAGIVTLLTYFYTLGIIVIASLAAIFIFMIIFRFIKSRKAANSEA